MASPSDPSPSAPLTSGVPPFDDLIGGVQVGDNLVLSVGDDTPIDWFVDAFIDASRPGRLLVVDTTDRHQPSEGVGLLRWNSGAMPGKDAASRGREAFDSADQEIGTDGRVVIDSLSDVARTWGSEEALDLFLVECPRLFRRRSIALWIVRPSEHERSFLEQLRAVTQVVVSVDMHEGARLQMRVDKAVGRAESVIARTLRATLQEGALVDVDDDWVHELRLGTTIRQLRARHGIGQAELARRIGISPSALSQAERGVRGISGETVLRLWEAVGTPLLPAAEDPSGFHVGRRHAATQQLAPSVSGRLLVSSPRSTSWEVVFAGRSRGKGPLFAAKGVETVVIHQGVLQLAIGSETISLQVGDALVLESVQLDAWRNPAGTSAVATWNIGS